MSKKTFVLLVLFVLMSLLVAQCAQQTEEPKPAEPEVEVAPTEEPEVVEPVELIWNTWVIGEWGEDWVTETYINPFETEHPNIKVKWEDYPWGDHETKALTLAQNKQLVDILHVANVRGAPLDDLGAFEDLTPYIEAEGPEFKELFMDAGFTRRGGKIIGLAWSATPYGLVYNKDIFTEKGITEIPKSFEQIKEVLRELRDPETGFYGTAITMDMSNANVMTWVHMAFYMANHGSSMLDENGKAQFNNEVGVEALNYWISLIEEDLVVPGPTALNHSANREYFCSGQTALILDGAFMKGICHERDPDMNMGFVYLEDGEGGHTTGGGFYSMSAWSEHKDEVWEFIKFAMSYDIALAQFLHTGQAPMVKIYEDPQIIGDEFAEVTGQILADPDTILMPLVTNSPELQRVLLEQCQAVLLEGKDPKAALDEAVVYWNEILGK